MSVVIGYDAIHANIGALPKGQAAGYTTGSPDIAWTKQDWASHPGAIRICQDSGASDQSADILDVERYAAANADAPGWYQRAASSFTSGTRQGQRWPACYSSASNITPLVNALIAGGVTAGCGLFIANWSLAEPQAALEVVDAAGPFPIIGIQYTSLASYDVDVFSSAWLAKVSGLAQYPHETDGKTNFAGLASPRGMQVLRWLAEQEAMHPDDAINMVSSAVPPAGKRWWSHTP